LRRNSSFLYYFCSSRAGRRLPVRGGLGWLRSCRSERWRQRDDAPAVAETARWPMYQTSLPRFSLRGGKWREKVCVSETFVIGRKYASYEAVSYVVDTQKLPRFANFRLLFCCPKSPHYCPFRSHFRLQKLTFGPPKGILLHAKRYPFASPKDTFRKTEGKKRPSRGSFPVFPSLDK
jgi:hypothetical protein